MRLAGSRKKTHEAKETDGGVDTVSSGRAGVVHESEIWGKGVSYVVEKATEEGRAYEGGRQEDVRAPLERDCDRGAHSTDFQRCLKAPK